MLFRANSKNLLKLVFILKSVEQAINPCRDVLLHPNVNVSIDVHSGLDVGMTEPDLDLLG